MKYKNFLCPYELASKLHKLGVDSETEFYFVEGGIPKFLPIITTKQKLLVEKWVKERNKKRSFIPAFMSHELGGILPSIINTREVIGWDDWL